MELATEHQLMFWALGALWNLGAIAVLRNERKGKDGMLVSVCATRVLGFVDAYFKSMKTPVMQYRDVELYERTVTALRKLIGVDEVANLMAEGAVMTEEKAFREASKL